MSKIAVALGGNALGDTLLVAAGHNVVVAHGNGSQVGMIKAAFGEDMPFPRVYGGNEP